MNSRPHRLACLAALVSLLFPNLVSSAPAANPIPAPDETTTTGICELLVSTIPEERERGKVIVAEKRASLITELLGIIQGKDPRARSKAGYELGLIISPWLRGKEASARFYSYTKFDVIQRPVGRQATRSKESTEIREVLCKVIAESFDSEYADSGQKYSALRASGPLFETLGEVADDGTIDWAFHQISRRPAEEVDDQFLRLTDTHLGLRPTFRNHGHCGNSTPEERAGYEVRRQEDVKAATASLELVWRKLRLVGPERRITYAIKNWRDHFVPYMMNYSGHYHRHYGPLHVEFEPLIRLGAPAVELLRDQQENETLLEVKAVWEMVIAAITGEEDHELVKALLAGRETHRDLACEVIRAAGSKAWLKELTDLWQTDKQPPRAIAKVMAEVHGREVIGLLYRRKEHEMAEELDKRAKEGAPRGMRRWGF